MAKNFAVVTFPSDGSNSEEIVSEVPSLWLSSNLTKCWWPSVKNINSFIVKQIPPVTNDPRWSCYKIKFHGYCDSLDEARKRTMIYSSSEESNDAKNSRKQINVFHESESDSDSDSRLNISSPPTLTVLSDRKSQPALNHTNASVVNNIDIEILEGNVLVPQQNIQDVHILLQEMSKKIEDHFNKIYIAMTTVTLGIEDMNIRLTNLEKQNNLHIISKTTTDILNIQQYFPFKSTSEITAFENRLSQSVEDYDKFVQYISRIGGNSAKENLIRIYRTLFSNEVAKESSWKGLRNHYKISSLKSVLKGIQATILDQYQTFTNKEFEDITKEWFRQGGQRFTRQQREEVNPDII